MNPDVPPGLSARDWANAGLHLTKLEGGDPEDAIDEIRKVAVVNGVEHVQFVWLNQQQLRGIGIDHGL